MSEPETITLRKLPPEHVLRRCDVYFDSMGSVNARSSIGKHVIETDHVWWCRAKDYPPEYDKPAIDPGEGWRLLEPDELVQEGDEFWLVNAWDKSSNWFGREQRQASGCTYRRRITPQPDRLTELRQQVERQAARIVELEASEKELQEKLRILKHNHSEQGKALTEQGEYIEALQTQVRSAEEALRVERQKHDEAVKQLEKSIDVYDHGVTKIYNTLNDVSPGWYRHDGNAYDDACKAIRLLATQNKSLIEQSNKTHEANVELQRQVQQLAEQNKPLRWERRKPTEEECRERWIVERDETGTVYGWEPGEQPADKYHTMICVLPPIAGPEPEPEPERRMVTQRRWLVNGPDGWQEEWPKDGEAPGSEWLELIKTSRTREVPE